MIVTTKIDVLTSACQITYKRYWNDILIICCNTDLNMHPIYEISPFIGKKHNTQHIQPKKKNWIKRDKKEFKQMYKKNILWASVGTDNSQNSLGYFYGTWGAIYRPNTVKSKHTFFHLNNAKLPLNKGNKMQLYIQSNVAHLVLPDTCNQAARHVYPSMGTVQNQKITICMIL